MDSHQYDTQPSDIDIVAVLDDKYVRQTLMKKYHVKAVIHETMYESSDSILVSGKSANIPHTLVAYPIAVVVAKLTSGEFAMRNSL